MTSARAPSLAVEVALARGDEKTLGDRLRAIETAVKRVGRTQWLIVALVALSGHVTPETLSTILKLLGVTP